jgi:hypothetical protein
MQGGARSGAGRKPIHIDLTQLERLCVLQCTDEELADWFGVSSRTIEKRRQKPEFAEAMRRGRVRGRISVRRAQMKLLQAGNSTLAVWLGKQLLGQRENVQLSGPSGGPIEVSDARSLSEN